MYAARQGMRAVYMQQDRGPSPVLLHIYCTCFSTFRHCHPYILMETFSLPCFTGFSLYTHLQICICVSPTPLCCSWSCEMHVGNNKEMAFNYMKVLVYRSFTCPRRLGPTKIPLVKGTAHRNKKLLIQKSR